MSKWIEKWVVYGSPEPDRKNISYIVARDVDNNFGCSCAAWKFQKGHKNDCKHIGQKKEEITTGKLSEINGLVMQYYSYGLICFLKELQKTPLLANKEIRTVLSLSDVPASRETLLSIGVTFYPEKYLPKINMACGAGLPTQVIINGLINKLSFYRVASNQFANVDYQKNIVSQAVTGQHIFPIFNFLTLLDGAYLATACLRPLLDGIKDLLSHLPANPKKKFFKDKEGHRFYIAWPEMLTSKLFNRRDMITTATDLIKPEKVASITEAFNNLLLKDFGAEYATLLMEDKLQSQPESLSRSFY